MFKRVICTVLAPLMVLQISAPVFAGEAESQVFMTSAAPLSQGEMDQYSQQQHDADQAALLCQGADTRDTAAVIAGVVVLVLLVALLVAASSSYSYY